MLPFSIDRWNWDLDSRIVFLTGAGISAESGVRTFRDAGGLWEGHSIDEVATPEGFSNNPSLVIDFYNKRREQLVTVKPNSGHLSLSRLQKYLGKRMTLVTQNVDDLHERGGSQDVIHMHGELKKLRCLDEPSHIHFFDGEQHLIETKCSICSGTMRPHIVWFGEIPFDMHIIEDAVRRSTHFVYVGTSSQVYPAAGYKSLAKAHGAKVLNFNIEIDKNDADTDFYIEGPTGVTLSDWVDSLLALDRDLQRTGD